jgi:signal transduction histidine kinase/ActR/RegA family two-component response regulator
VRTAKKTTLRRVAERKVREAPRKSPVPTRAQTARLGHELEVHRIELELQNEELRESRLAVEAALARYTELFDFAPIGYVTLTPTGTIREINHAGARMFAAPRSAIVGKKFERFVEPSRREAFTELLRSAWRSQSKQTCHVATCGPRQVHLRLSAVALAEREPMVLLAFEDVGESEARAKALLAEAVAALAEARGANRAKDEFLANLSHELRTPLAAIFVWAGALRSGAVPPGELGRAVDAIVRSAESQSRLIEDLLDLSRLASGKLRLAPSPVAIGDLARAAVEIFRPFADANGLVLELDVPADLGMALLDPVRLNQILGNMLSNATKFTPAGRVTLRARKGGGHLELEVADTGIGMTPEFLSNVFEKFRQAEMGETRRHAGLGIGLALTRQLVELHGGTIEAHSEGLGRGSVFRVRLPWVDAGSGAASNGPQAPFATASRTNVETALEDVTVLLVEDDTNTREAMKWALERARARVLPVGTAREALEQIDGLSARERRSLVIVSDLGLPERSGYDLMKRIRARCQKRGENVIPACAVSAHARDVDKRRALEAGFDFYVAKPVMPDRLVAAVEDLRDIAAEHAE